MQVLAGRVWPAMLTPLDDAGEPNLALIEPLVERFVEQELGGLFILGSTGQGVLLSLDARRLVAKRVVQAAAGRIAVMVHVGAVATADAVALARHAAQIGADAVSSVPPIYYPTSFDVTLAHYQQIGAATDLPFFPYHASFLQRAVPPAPEYAERLLTIAHIAGMKFTDHDLYAMSLVHQYAGGRLAILSGADELLCQAALSGAVGAIGTFYNQWGSACQRARLAFDDGRVDPARRFMAAFARAIDEILRAGSMWSFHRASMQMRYGLDIGPPRQPLGLAERTWSPADAERLLALVDDAAP